MNRKMLCGLLAASLLFLLPMERSQTVFGAVSAAAPVMYHTENDLREIMGLERIEGEKWEQAAAGILAQCASRETYNELVDALAFVSDEDAKEYERQAIKKQQYYEEYMRRFLAGEPAEAILEPLAQYNRLYLQLNQTVVNTVTGTIGGAERYDIGEIKAQEAYAKALLLLCESDADIGGIGQDMDTFLKADLRLKDMTADTISVYTAEDDPVYAQFSGVVTQITEDTVTIQSGEVTVLSYSGITAAKKLYVGHKIKQYQRIGKAKGESVSLTLTSALCGENPLRMYGQRAAFWQEAYLRTQLTDCYTVDFSLVKDDIDEKANTAGVASTMTDADGNESLLTVEDNPYTGDEIVIDKDGVRINGEDTGMEGE